MNRAMEGDVVAGGQHRAPFHPQGSVVAVLPTLPTPRAWRVRPVLSRRCRASPALNSSLCLSLCLQWSCCRRSCGRERPTSCPLAPPPAATPRRSWRATRQRLLRTGRTLRRWTLENTTERMRRQRAAAASAPPVGGWGAAGAWGAAGLRCVPLGPRGADTPLLQRSAAPRSEPLCVLAGRCVLHAAGSLPTAPHKPHLHLPLAAHRAGKVVGVIRRNWRTRGYCGSLQVRTAQGGGANGAFACLPACPRLLAHPPDPAPRTPCLGSLPTPPPPSHPLNLQPPKPGALGRGSGNHTESHLFMPVERRFPYIRIHTRQVGGSCSLACCPSLPPIRQMNRVCLQVHGTCVLSRLVGSGAPVCGVMGWCRVAARSLRLHACSLPPSTLAHARLKAEASDHHMRWPLVMSLAQQPAVTKVGAVTHTPDP